MHQIRYFLALSDTLNFTRAAEQCNVSQPSLTRAIRSLEFELGGDLIRRERSLSHLTELGQRIVPILRQSYESALAAKELATSFKKGGTVPLAVAISQSVRVVAFVPIFQNLSKAFPGLQLELKRGNASAVSEMLKNGEAELAIAGQFSAEWERFDGYPLFADPYQLFVCRDHPISRLKRVDASALADERLLLYPEEDPAGGVTAWLRGAKIDGSATYQVATGSDMTSLLEANMGVAIIPASTMQSPVITSVALDGFDLARTVAVYCVAGRQRSQAGSTALNLLRSLDWESSNGSQAVRGTA